MPQIKLTDATAEQVRDYAALQNIDGIAKNAAAATVLSKLRMAGIDVDAVTIEVEGEPVVLEEPKAAKAPKGAKKVTINIAKEALGSNHPVWVAVNGKGMLIPRGENVVVPEKYYLNLMDSITPTYPNADDKGLGKPVMVPRFPVTLVKG